MGRMQLHDWASEDARAIALQVMGEIERRDRDEFAARRSQRIDALRAESAIPPVYARATVEAWDVAEEYPAEQQRRMRLCRELAQRAVLHWDSWLNDGRWLHLYGGEGTGKTLLACIMANGLLSIGASVRYVQAAGASEAVRDAYSTRATTERKLIDGWVGCDLLILDELGAQTATEHDARITWSIVNGRYLRGAPMIVITNFALSSLEQMLGPNVCGRIAERAGGPWSLDMTWPSWRRRAR